MSSIEDTASDNDAVEFALIEANRTMSKAFALDDRTGLAVEAEFDQTMRDGTTQRRKVSDGKLNEGKAYRMRLSRVSELAGLLESLTEKHVIVAGRIVRDDIGDEVRIMSEKRRAEFATKGRDVSMVIERSKEDLAYAPGPCLLGFDHDAGRLAQEYRDRLAAAGGAWAVLSSICASLHEVEALVMASSSDGILRASDGSVARVSGSQHIWLIATDSAAVEAFLRLLHERLVLAGWGWVFVTQAGTAEVRSIIDLAASGKAERVWFSGPPLLKPGLVRRDGARTPTIMNQGCARLDCASALAPLDEADRVRLQEIEAALIAAHAEEIAAKKAAHRERMRAKMEARGATKEEIERRFGCWEKFDLDGEAMLYLDDGSGIEVAEVLHDPDAFVRQYGDGTRVTMRDPLEPDYHGSAGNVAVLDVADGRTPTIFSHAHGGQRFTLGWGVDDLRRAAEAAAVLAEGPGLVGAVGMALLPLWPRRLAGVNGEALDGALAGLGLGMGDLFAWEIAEAQAAWVTGLASGLSVGVPAAELGLHGGEPGADAVDGLAWAERLVDGGGIASAGLREALEAFWREAEAEDAEGTGRLRQAVGVALAAEREALARRAGLDADADEVAAGEGGEEAASEGGTTPAPDDDPIENWSQGKGLKRSTQHAAVNVLLYGLRLGGGKLVRDIRAGDVLLRGVREGSEAWKALRLAKVKPAFVEPLTGRKAWVWSDDLTNAAVGWAQKNGVMLTAGVMLDGVLNVANINALDPVADYLQRLERAKVWDGVGRLDGWLVRHGGADEGPVGEKALRLMMIGAVARALLPVESAEAVAAQVDTVLVLTGPQGGRKSAALRLLARLPWWHSESVVGNLTDKDNLLNVHRAWITDISEGTSLKRSDVTAIKQFVTTPMDTVRLPYGRLPGPRIRRGVLCCTINDDGTGFLADVTGARRFMVVQVERIDTDVLKAEVDQMWAEAVALYRRGEKWWIDEGADSDSADGALRDALAATADERRVKTSVEVLVERFLREKPMVRNSNGSVASWEPRPVPLTAIPGMRLIDLIEEIGLDPVRDDYSPAKVGRALTALGWRKARVWERGEAVGGLERGDYVWVSRAGIEVRKKTRHLSNRAKFPGWLEEQRSRGSVYAGKTSGRSGVEQDFPPER